MGEGRVKGHVVLVDGEDHLTRPVLWKRRGFWGFSKDLVGARPSRPQVRPPRRELACRTPSRSAHGCGASYAPTAEAGREGAAGTLEVAFQQSTQRTSSKISPCLSGFSGA
jgi:hypothetical protein